MQTSGVSRRESVAVYPLFEIDSAMTLRERSAKKACRHGVTAGSGSARRKFCGRTRTQRLLKLFEAMGGQNARTGHMTSATTRPRPLARVSPTALAAPVDRSRTRP